MGDGHETETSLHYYTSSIKLRDDIQRLCQHAGYTSYYAKRYEKGHQIISNGKVFNCNADNWDMGIRKTRLNPTVNHGHIHTQKGQREEINYYNGKVYCLSVASEVFMVRRNGRCVWTGNSNRHGQKGTIGMMLRDRDMPRSVDGIVPDLIMNPHAIPSRMTIGQLFEQLLGKVAANLGAIGNATPFMNEGSPHTVLGEALTALGLECTGNEILYDGQSGKQVEAAIFMGPLYVTRLKHMTEDKWNARGAGRKEQRTHQPTGGRGAQGGLKIGEMERDAIVAHGIGSFVEGEYDGA